MNQDAEEKFKILDKKEVYSGFLRVEEITFWHKRYDGTNSEPMVRLNLNRGDSAAALIYDTDKDELIFTEQFRCSTAEKGPGWILEIPAGTIEEGEEPKDSMIRELEEEIGYSVSELTFISRFYVSPGGTSERLFVYFAKVTQKDNVSAGGGKLSEGEDIKVVSIPVDEAFQKVRDGEIVDAKTIIALQWFELNRNRS